jgi:pyruvate/2-oxoglutarate dehydrogenase complex dihydrolipoamide dehydrogenase (E3) component
VIARLGVVGGGQMGQGIAQVAAQAGLDVVLVDVTAELAAAAIGKLGKTLDKLVEKGKLAAEQRDATVARLRAGGSHADARRSRRRHRGRARAGGAQARADSAASARSRGPSASSRRTPRRSRSPSWRRPRAGRSG